MTDAPTRSQTDETVLCALAWAIDALKTLHANDTPVAVGNTILSAVDALEHATKRIALVISEVDRVCDLLANRDTAGYLPEEVAAGHVQQLHAKVVELLHAATALLDVDPPPFVDATEDDIATATARPVTDHPFGMYDPVADLDACIGFARAAATATATPGMRIRTDDLQGFAASSRRLDTFLRATRSSLYELAKYALYEPEKTGPEDHLPKAVHRFVSAFLPDRERVERHFSAALNRATDRLVDAVRRPTNGYDAYDPDGNPKSTQAVTEQIARIRELMKTYVNG